MAAGFLGYGAVSVVVGTFIYANLPTRFTIGAVSATVAHLADAKLIKVDDEKDVLAGKQIRAKDLFDQGPILVMAVRRPGCGFCRHEAKDLSSIKDKLDAAGVKLVGVVHETHGVNEFKPFLKGDIYYDIDVSSPDFDDYILTLDSILAQILWPTRTLDAHLVGIPSGVDLSQRLSNSRYEGQFRRRRSTSRWYLFD